MTQSEAREVLAIAERLAKTPQELAEFTRLVRRMVVAEDDATDVYRRRGYVPDRPEAPRTPELSASR